MSLQCFRVGGGAWGVQWHPEVLGETILHWAQEHRPTEDGVPVDIDTDALRAQVSDRIQETNAEGRELCARFLEVAEQRAGRRTVPPKDGRSRLKAGVARAGQIDSRPARSS